MARQREGVRVLGPYPEPDRERFRIVVVDRRGRTNHFYKTEAEAKQVARSLRRKYGVDADRTIDKSIDEYEMWMKDTQNGKGNKARSAVTTAIRLRTFLADVLDLPVSQLSQTRCSSIYTAYRTKPTKRTKKPPAVDIHRNVLSESKTFLDWCVKKKWLSVNPMLHIEAVGKRRHGKEQLRVDESRKWLGTALAWAESKSLEQATAAMTTLLLGLRSTEIVSRVVRDVDDGGRLLWIPDAKTPAGKRTLEVPEVLVPLLARLAADRQPDEQLFGRHWRDWVRKCVHKICRAAGVPTVTAHGMRGGHATLATERGVTGHVVAKALGHETSATTYQSYAKRSAVSAAKQRKVIEVLDLTSRVGNDSPPIVPQRESEKNEARNP